MKTAWVLWKYKGLLNSKIKEGTLNLVFIYDLVHDFEKGTRIAFEEVPFIFRLLGAFNGFILFALISFVDFHLWKNGWALKGFVQIKKLNRN